MVDPSEPKRLLVVMPNWVGDAVMATPTLRGLRERWPRAHIALLLRPQLKPLMDRCPWFDRMIGWRSKRPGAATNGRRGFGRLARRLRRERFDTALLLPNSFRSALLVSMARVARRIGYRRDGRGILLSESLDPPRRDGRWLPVPAVEYYLKLAQRLGVETDRKRPQLFTRSEDDLAAARWCDSLEGKGPLVLMNPGAATKGKAKLWPAERYGQLADALYEQHRARLLLNGAPAERPVLDAVRAASSAPMLDLPAIGSNLRRLKSVMQRCDLVISNDTGGRHIAAAMGTPLLARPRMIAKIISAMP